MTVTDPALDQPSQEPAARSGLRRLRLFLWLAIVAVVITGTALYLLRPVPQANVAEDYSSAFGGSFTMSDQFGRTVTDRTLRGKPYAIFFGFTRCPDVCPTSLNRMAQLRKQLGADGSKFDIVFVSVDPGHDKRADIKSYLELFGTPIIGLTGTDAQIAATVKAFHVYYEKVPIEGGDYTIDHTASIFLMDRNGRFVTTIDHQENQRVALEKLKRAMAIKAQR